DGPGTASKTAWLQPFASHEKVAILSMHTYVGTNSGATIAAMLASTQPGGRLPGEWTALQKAKQAHSVPVWRMTEANSYSHGGAAGVSDVQAAALWTLDFMYGIASHDGAGVNFHRGTARFGNFGVAPPGDRADITEDDPPGRLGASANGWPP